jgi:hypothetical protein
LALPRQALRNGLVAFLERCALDLRQTEIQQLYALPRHHDVGGLQIAMHDTLAVRVVQRLEDLV